MARVRTWRGAASGEEAVAVERSHKSRNGGVHQRKAAEE